MTVTVRLTRFAGRFARGALGGIAADLVLHFDEIHELVGLPALPTTTFAAYNIYNEPETITEAFGSQARTKKETYDAAGRRSSSETTATSDKALPKATFTYNSEQGVLEKESAEGKSLTSEYKPNPAAEPDRGHDSGFSENGAPGAAPPA